MALWRGDEHRRARKPAPWRKTLGAVTVPQPFKKTEETQMAEVTPPEKSDGPVQVATEAQVAAATKNSKSTPKDYFAIAGVALIVLVLAFVAKCS